MKQIQKIIQQHINVLSFLPFYMHYFKKICIFVKKYLSIVSKTKIYSMLKG